MTSEDAVRAVDFQSREVYRSAHAPGYTSWVSFFPGERGQWYLTCEEVTRPEPPLPQCTPEQWYAMGMPSGYDKSQYLMEAVVLESTDDMQTWREISRHPYRHQHSVHQFATARTRDGRFLRFIWACYSLDPSVAPNEVFYTSDDNGGTWRKEPPFHDGHFASYAHRLRELRDGTLVLAMPLAPRSGPDTQRPVRTCTDLNALGGMQMTLWFSYDQGHTWEGPLPIYAGQSVSETDFVELPEGHLLCINNSIFANPGRQIIYRDERQWTPATMERATNVSSWYLPEGADPRDYSMVPETVCLTEDGILVGCMRCSNYQWSDDLGVTWWPLEGAPDLSPEMYQPWIHYLGDGRVVCAGHYGHDDPISGPSARDQYLVLHEFRLDVRRRTKSTRIEIERDFDEKRNLWPNAYTLRLTADGKPLADKEIEFWHVMRYSPGHDSRNSVPLEERMAVGGTLTKRRTDAEGRAHVATPELDDVQDRHLSYQFVARFNADLSDADYKPAQSPQFDQYCICRQDPPLEERK